jgi:hypothetical protein
MGLTYAALDFVVTPEGEHVFLEINPAGQWGWIERALGMPITDAILDSLREGYDQSKILHFRGGDPTSSAG